MRNIKNKISAFKPNSSFYLDGCVMKIMCYDNNSEQGFMSDGLHFNIATKEIDLDKLRQDIQQLNDEERDDLEEIINYE